MTRQDVWNLIDEHQEELLKLCSDMIRIPSINPPGNVDEIVHYIKQYLEGYGIPYEVVAAREDKPNILARYGNAEGKTLVFNGHCDVVPAGDEEKWMFPPFSGEIKDGIMLGRGTSDMKCGLGAAMFAMCLLASQKTELSGNVLLTVVPDEETGGEFGTKWLRDQGYLKGDWGIVAEPTGMDNIEVGQKGTMGMNLYATGKTAHGSLNPYIGENAIEKLIHILPQMYQLREMKSELHGEQLQVMEESKDRCKAVQKSEGVETIMDHVTVNIGMIQGGVKRNVVADTAMAELDVRVPIGISHEAVMKKVDEIIKNSEIEGVYVTYDNPRGGNCVSVKDSIVTITQECVEELLGIECAATYQWASSDTRYFRESGIATIQYGASNTEGIHNYNETVNVADVIIACKIYAALILELVG